MTTPDTTGTPAPGGQHDALFATGMAAVSLAAAISSYSGLASLADLAGWNHRLALLLPLTIDAYALTATRVWLSPKTAGHRARRWAKGNAVGAIATSVAGNAVSHAAAAHVFTPSWAVVVLVSAIPSIVLGLITHLWHLRNTPDPVPATAPHAPTGTAPVPPARKRTSTPRPAAAATTAGKAPVRSDQELLDAGRLLAAELGAPPSATRLKKALGTGPDRARRLAALLAAETIPADTPAPEAA